MSPAEWALWAAIAAGITMRCLNMWAYSGSPALERFRADRRPFRTVMPVTGLVVGALAWSWGTYGTATANLVLALATLFPAFTHRQRWFAAMLTRPAGIILGFVVLPCLVVVVTPGSLPERVQMAGGYQLVVGFLAMLAGAWAGTRSADSWHWLVICLSVDLLLGTGAIALAATPIIALEVAALCLDLMKARAKIATALRTRKARAALLERVGRRASPTALT